MDDNAVDVVFNLADTRHRHIFNVLPPRGNVDPRVPTILPGPTGQWSNHLFLHRIF